MSRRDEREARRLRRIAKFCRDVARRAEALAEAMTSNETKENETA